MSSGNTEFRPPILATVSGVLVYNNGERILLFKRKGIDTGEFRLKAGNDPVELEQVPEVWEVRVAENPAKIIGEIKYDSPTEVNVAYGVKYMGASFACTVNLQP